MALIMTNAKSGDNYTWYNITNATSVTDGTHSVTCSINDIVAIMGVSGQISNITGGTLLMSVRTSGGSQHMNLVKATSTSVGFTSAGNAIYGIGGKID